MNARFTGTVLLVLLMVFTAAHAYVSPWLRDEQDRTGQELDSESPALFPDTVRNPPQVPIILDHYDPDAASRPDFDWWENWRETADDPPSPDNPIILRITPGETITGQPETESFVSRQQATDPAPTANYTDQPPVIVRNACRQRPDDPRCCTPGSPGCLPRPVPCDVCCERGLGSAACACERNPLASGCMSDHRFLPQPPATEPSTRETGADRMETDNGGQDLSDNSAPEIIAYREETDRPGDDISTVTGPEDADGGADAGNETPESGEADERTIKDVTEKAVLSTQGLHHTLFLLPDGSVWAMGSNGYGQLGSGDNLPRRTPVMVFWGARSITVGWNHSVVLDRDNSVWFTGDNRYGQIGFPDGLSRNVFTFFARDAKDVIAERNLTTILFEDGTERRLGSPSLRSGDITRQ